MWQCRTPSFFTLLLVLLLTLYGCKRGPGDQAMEMEIRQRLDAGFTPGLFSIASLTRKGSAPGSDTGEVYVYYDAELEFQRDYNLTAWRGLNLGTLAVVLGANPAGIEGYHSSNQKGDLLRVRGRLDYRKVEGGWQSIRRKTATTAPAVSDSLQGTGPAAVLDSVRRLVQRVPEGTRPTRDRIIIEQFSESVKNIELRFARLDGKLPFGTGWPGGTYNQFGEAFAPFAGKHELPVFNYSSEGSVENGLSLQQGHLDFALLQSDVAEVLYKGWIEAAQLPLTGLRSMASLWPEALHIVTLADRGIGSFGDLKGRALAVGSAQSGTRFTAQRVWAEAGYGHSDSGAIRDMGVNESISALENGEVDAIFIAGAIPYPALQELVQRRDDVQFVAIDAPILERLSTRHFAYYSTQIPARTYPGQTETYRTLGFAALLITNRQARDDDVERFLDLVVESASALTPSFYRAGFISTQTSRLGISIPMHPGASRFYEKLRDRAKPTPNTGDRGPK